MSALPITHFSILLLLLLLLVTDGTLTKHDLAISTGTGGDARKIRIPKKAEASLTLDTYEVMVRQLKRLLNGSRSQVILKQLLINTSAANIVLRVAIGWIFLLVSKLLILASPIFFSDLIKQATLVDSNVVPSKIVNLFDSVNLSDLFSKSILGLIIGYSCSKCSAGVSMYISELTVYPLSLQSAGILPLEVFTRIISSTHHMQSKINSTDTDTAGNANSSPPVYYIRRALDRGMKSSERFFYRAVFNLFPCFIEVLCIMIMMARYTGVLPTVIATIFMFSYVSLTAVTMSYRVPLLRKVLSEEGKANECVEDALALYDTVKAFGASSTECRKYASALISIKQSNTIVRSSFSRLKLMQSFIVGVGSGILAVSAYNSAIATSSSVASKLVLIQALFLQLCLPLDKFAEHFRECVSNLEDLRELELILSTYQHDKQSHTGANNSRIDYEEQQRLLGKSVPLLAVKNLSYTANRESVDCSTLLSNVSFTIAKRGHSIGICGSSGSGKSSLMKLLVGIEECQSGTIEYGSVDITYSKRDFYFCTVLQMYSLFRTMSLTDNIKYGIDNFVTVPDEENVMTVPIANAARDAHIDSLLYNRDKYFNTQLLSGGEAQRICLARALYHEEVRGGILVLDEFTSSIDSNLEALILQALFHRIKVKGSSAIIIAHKLSTISRCDEILVLGTGGVVTERGSHEQLMNAKGWYYKMWMLQNTKK